MEEVIKKGVLPRFVEFLLRQELPQLQLEAAWVLTNITYGASEHTLLVTEHGAVPKLVELLESPSYKVREQAVWALGNIAADSQSCRELVLDHGALLPLLAQINEDARISMLRTAIWALSNLCFGKLLTEAQLKPILEMLCHLIHSMDEKILADACWTLYYLCEGTDDELQWVIEAGVCSQLVKLLMHPDPRVVVPVISAIARISAGDDTQVKTLIDNDVLHHLVQLLIRKYQKSIKRQACLTISNITAGSKIHIQAVIDANIISCLVQLLQYAEMDIKKEVAWAISNAAIGGSSEQIHYLVSQGCVEPLCNFLTSQDPDLLYACLEGLNNILRAGTMEQQSDKAETNPYAQLIAGCGGLENLENLQDFDNDDIYKKVIKLLEKYWDEEESDEHDFQGSADSEEAAPASLEATQTTSPSGGNEVD